MRKTCYIPNWQQVPNLPKKLDPTQISQKSKWWTFVFFGQTGTGIKWFLLCTFLFACGDNPWGCRSIQIKNPESCSHNDNNAMLLGDPISKNNRGQLAAIKFIAQNSWAAQFTRGRFDSIHCVVDCFWKVKKRCTTRYDNWVIRANYRTLHVNGCSGWLSCPNKWLKATLHKQTKPQ